MFTSLYINKKNSKHNSRWDFRDGFQDRNGFSPSTISLMPVSNKARLMIR